MDKRFSGSVIASPTNLSGRPGQRSATLGAERCGGFSGSVVAVSAEFGSRIGSRLAATRAWPGVVGDSDSAAIGRMNQPLLLGRDHAITTSIEEVAAANIDRPVYSVAGQNARHSWLRATHSNRSAELGNVHEPVKRTANANVTFFRDMAVAVDHCGEKSNDSVLWRVENIGRNPILLDTKALCNPLGKSHTVNHDAITAPFPLVGTRRVVVGSSLDMSWAIQFGATFYMIQELDGCIEKDNLAWFDVERAVGDPGSKQIRDFLSWRIGGIPRDSISCWQSQSFAFSVDRGETVAEGCGNVRKPQRGVFVKS